MVCYTHSYCSRLGYTARGNVEPTEAPKSPATTQLEHFEVCHDGVFACSKRVHNGSVSVKELPRAVSW